jgi:hypothetical protein
MRHFDSNATIRTETLLSDMRAHHTKKAGAEIRAGP